MDIFEKIIWGVIGLTFFSAGSVGLFLFAKYLIIYPLSSYYTKRGKNKLQWKATGCEFSRETKTMLKLNGKDSTFLKSFDLEWRILPSELPYIIRVYGYNDWKKFNCVEIHRFNNEQEFKHFVSDFKTLKDLREYHKKIDDKIVWYEP